MTITNASLEMLLMSNYNHIIQNYDKLDKIMMKQDETYHKKEFSPEENKKLNEIFREFDDEDEPPTIIKVSLCKRTPLLYREKKIVKCGLNIDILDKLLYSEDIMAQTKKKSEHYVNNKEFLKKNYGEYKKSVNKAKKIKEKNHQYQIILVNVF